MKEFWIYTGLRLLLFLGSLGIVVGVWSFFTDAVPIPFALIIALLISGIGSYFLLSHHREALARRVEGRAERMSTRLGEMKSREDED